jgi:hypothetical protein
MRRPPGALAALILTVAVADGPGGHRGGASAAPAAKHRCQPRGATRPMLATTCNLSLAQLQYCSILNHKDLGMQATLTVN